MRTGVGRWGLELNVATGLQAGRRDGLKPVAYGHVKMLEACRRRATQRLRYRSLSEAANVRKPRGDGAHLVEAGEQHRRGIPLAGEKTVAESGRQRPDD